MSADGLPAMDYSLSEDIFVGEGTFGPDDPADLAGAQAFFGDWYRASDNVTRGVVMAPMPDCGVPAGFDTVLDFPSLDAGILPNEDFGDLVPISHLGAGDAYSMQKVPDKAVSEGSDDDALFSEVHTVPLLPDDPFFKLEPTTIQVDVGGGRYSPRDVGNDLLEFLRARAATILKLGKAKVSVKAFIFAGNLSCTVKAKIYDMGGDRYALELQKRSGEGFAFGEFYQQVSAFIASKPYRAGSAASEPVAANHGAAFFGRPEVPMAPAGPGGVSGKRVAAEVMPLLDMAGSTHMPSLQAEGANLLFDIVCDPLGAATLCSELALDRVQTLLKAADLDVAHPTARLLLQMARSVHAASWFLSEGLLLDIVDRVRSSETPALVRTELAQVVKVAMDRCGGQLSMPARCGVADAIGSAMQELGGSTHSQRARLDLQAAQTSLWACSAW